MSTDAQRQEQRAAFRTLGAAELEALHTIALGITSDRMLSARIRVAASDLGFIEAYRRMGKEVQASNEARARASKGTA